MMRHRYLLWLLLLLTTVGACSQKKERINTPWGTTLGEDSVPSSSAFALKDIVDHGELIMLTLTGPENYYDYHGHGMGLQYLLCEKFAKTLGVSLRVEVCKDTAEMVKKLKGGDGDLIAFFLPDTIRGLRFCGATREIRRTDGLCWRRIARWPIRSMVGFALHC